MGSLGTPELIIIAVIVLLVFGGAWLPKLARNLGRTKVEVDKAKTEFEKTKAELAESTGMTEIAETVKKVDQTLKTPAKTIVKKNLTP